MGILALTRKPNEKIVCRISHEDLCKLVQDGRGFKMVLIHGGPGNNGGNAIKLCIDAPQELAIYREELDVKIHKDETA